MIPQYSNNNNYQSNLAFQNIFINNLAWALFNNFIQSFEKNESLPNSHGNPNNNNNTNDIYKLNKYNKIRERSNNKEISIENKEEKVHKALKKRKDNINFLLNNRYSNNKNNIFHENQNKLNSNLDINNIIKAKKINILVNTNDNIILSQGNTNNKENISKNKEDKNYDSNVNNNNNN